MSDKKRTHSDRTPFFSVRGADSRRSETMSPSESLRALRRVNPRSRPGFNESIEEYDALRTQIASTAYVAPRRFSPIVRKHRLIGVSIAGALLSTAAVLAAVVMLSGGSTESAYAAANKAVTATAASAIDSGTIVTQLSRGGDTVSTETTHWNGSDISMKTVFGTATSELRLVDRDSYGLRSDGRWTHFDADSTRLPAFLKEMLASARVDVAGTTVHNIIDATGGLEQTENADGSTAYSGTANADASIGSAIVAIDPTNGSVLGLATRAIRTIANAKGRSTVVSVQLTVGSDGLIRSLRVSFESGGESWLQTSDYSQLGSTPAIEAPDPSTVVEAG
jgi:hypothetical protein